MPTECRPSRVEGSLRKLYFSTFPIFQWKRRKRLNDPRLRENFIERVFAYARLRSLFSGPGKLGT